MGGSGAAPPLHAGQSGLLRAQVLPPPCHSLCGQLSRDPSHAGKHHRRLQAWAAGGSRLPARAMGRSSRGAGLAKSSRRRGSVFKTRGRHHAMHARHAALYGSNPWSPLPRVEPTTLQPAVLLMSRWGWWCKAGGASSACMRSPSNCWCRRAAPPPRIPVGSHVE